MEVGLPRVPAHTHTHTQTPRSIAQGADPAAVAQPGLDRSPLRASGWTGLPHTQHCLRVQCSCKGLCTFVRSSTSVPRTVDPRENSLKSAPAASLRAYRPWFAPRTTPSHLQGQDVYIFDDEHTTHNHDDEIDDG